MRKAISELDDELRALLLEIADFGTAVFSSGLVVAILKSVVDLFVEAGRGNFKHQKTLTMMDYETQERRPPTKEEREAKKEKARREAERVLAERKKEDESFRANFERLKAERLARETKS